MAMPTALAKYWRNHRRPGGKKKAKSRSVSMAKSSRSHKMTLPIAVILGFVPLVSQGVALVKSGGLPALSLLPSALVPYNFQTRRIDFSGLGSGLYPILAGLAVHKIVGGYMGVNRSLAAARIPWLRI